MKRFLVILLYLSSCLFFGPEDVNAAPHNASIVYSKNSPRSSGAGKTEAMKSQKLSGLMANQENDAKVYQAARPEKATSEPGFMDSGLLALLLIIMLLGMLYSNPSR